MPPRKLVIVCIDDKLDNQAALRKYGDFFEISGVTGMGDACRAIIADRSSDKVRDPVDIYLVDVDMSANPGELKAFDFGGGKAGLMPYGPVLGLVFMSVRPTTQFVPYSEFWDRPEVMDNGFVLLALSFILSAIEGKQFTLSQTKKKLAEWHNTAKLPHEAVGSGLRRFRDTLLAQAKRGRIEPRNIETLVDDLSELAEADDKFVFPLSRVSDGNELAVEWVYVLEATSEQVSLHSMFADLFGYKDFVSSNEIRTIVDELGKLIPHSVEAAVHTPLVLAEAAADVLTKCWNEKRCVNVLQCFTKKHELVKSDEDVFQLRRSVMLAGWVFAWHQKRFEGISDVRGTWEGLFFRKNEEGKGGSEHWLPAYLARRQEVSYERHRTPFQAANSSADAETFVKDSYCLDHDAPAYLTASDRAVCRFFAQRHLHNFLAQCYAPGVPDHKPWQDEAAAPYPRWMNVSEAVPWIRGQGLTKPA